MKNNKYEFESKRLYFRETELDDKQFLTTLFGDKNRMKYIPNKIETENDVNNMIEKLIEDRGSEYRTSYFFIIEAKNDYKKIGIVNLKILVNNDESLPILGYILLDDFWGKGFATEAAYEMIKYGFQELNLSFITASTAVENVGSEGVLKKIKMKKDKIIKNGLKVNNNYFDEVRYKILRQEYI